MQMARSSEQSNLWHPKHWPTWFGLTLFWTLSNLHWREQQRVARFLGCIVYHCVPIRRRVVFTNLQLCFPEKSGKEIRHLARAHYNSLALGLFETCAGWWAPTNELPTHRLVGFDHFESALAQGRGVILLTAHFTSLELCGRLMAEAGRFGCLYRDPDNHVLAHIMRRQRERHAAIAVHFNDLKGLIRALRSGHSIWYAPDQGQRTASSEIIPFFGVPAVTNTATGKIASMTGAAVVPYFARREPDHSYTLTLLPALANFPTADPIADALRINLLIETHIRLAPEQYFWVHKRFKRRGPEYPDVY
jgi:Kdo2-lipid IVA lauroyltransferase/acyltransferase